MKDFWLLVILGKRKPWRIETVLSDYPHDRKDWVSWQWHRIALALRLRKPYGGP
jgi:hypothetical protein